MSRRPSSCVLTGEHGGVSQARRRQSADATAHSTRVMKAMVAGGKGTEVAEPSDGKYSTPNFARAPRKLRAPAWLADADAETHPRGAGPFIGR